MIPGLWKDDEAEAERVAALLLHDQLRRAELAVPGKEFILYAPITAEVTYFFPQAYRYGARLRKAYVPTVRTISEAKHFPEIVTAVGYSRFWRTFLPPLTKVFLKIVPADTYPQTKERRR
jgi:hypothetical protein